MEGSRSVIIFKQWREYVSDWGSRNGYAFDGYWIFQIHSFCSKYCPFCGFTSISQFKSHSSDHRVLTDSKSDKHLDHLEDCWARDQILEKKWIHIWYGSCYFHIYTNCTICGVSLLPERRFKVHDALFIWCLEGCH